MPNAVGTPRTDQNGSRLLGKSGDLPPQKTYGPVVDGFKRLLRGQLSDHYREGDSITWLPREQEKRTNESITLDRQIHRRVCGSTTRYVFAVASILLGKLRRTKPG